LLKFGDAQVLRLTDTGQIELSVATSTGTQTLTSAPVSLNSWQQVIAKVDAGSIILKVGGQQLSAPLAGTVSYTGITNGAEAIVIGNGFAGHIAGMTYYDLESSPLLQFDDGTISREVVLDGNGAGNLNVISTGEFKYSGTDKPLPSMLVGISANDTIGPGISLISTEEYQELASMSYDVLGSTQTFDRFKELFAGSHFYGSKEVLAERLLSYVMDHTQVDIHIDGYKELTALKGVLSLLRRMPEARTLVPYVQTLLDYFTAKEAAQGATITYALAEEVYKRVQPLLRGQSVNIDEIALPLLVLGEMITDVPLAADRIAASVVSTEDFVTWLRFLSLPATGWVGYEPPVPPLESNCSDSDNYQVQTSTPELSLPLLPCRLTGQQAGAIINSFFDQTPGLAENPELLPPTIFEILENLPMADTYLRKYLFN
jgi:hypothetical protein